MRDRILHTIGTNTYITNVKITFVSNAQRDTFNTNVIHVGILLFPDENECSFDVRFLKYVDTLPLLLRANYTRFAREDNVFEKSG
jgi:hypothetical protein